MKINTASATIPNNMAHAIPMAKPSLKVEIRNKGIGLKIHNVVAFANIGAAFSFHPYMYSPLPYSHDVIHNLYRILSLYFLFQLHLLTSNLCSLQISQLTE